jgi:type IV pilus assembly protein PilW
MIRSRVRGFSVIELMVAMTLSLVMLGGALAVTYSSKVTYNQNERVARLQESGRTALELMTRDIRGSGFRGCSRAAGFKNLLNDPTTVLWNFESPVQGFDSTGPGAWAPALPAEVASPEGENDVLVVRAVRAGQPTFTTSTAMASATADIEVNYPIAGQITPGRTLLISDCIASAVFSATAVDESAADIATLSLTEDVAVPGMTEGNDSVSMDYEFAAGSQVAPIDSVIYYIRESDTVRNGVQNPALWQIVGAQAPQELIEGVEAMQVRYGVDTNNDGIINSYEDADGVANWRRVISVSVALLIRSVEPNALETDTRTYRLLDTDVGPFNDGYQRTVFTTTAALRNSTN